MGSEELMRLTLVEAMGLLRRRALSPVELVQAFIARIERLNPVLNAF
jgi:Asp-tRNA(Asn)/Glu-tRNA(Gln) amidotransferase A subunit family amidase